MFTSSNSVTSEATTVRTQRKRMPGCRMKKIKETTNSMTRLTVTMSNILDKHLELRTWPGTMRLTTSNTSSSKGRLRRCNRVANRPMIQVQSTIECRVHSSALRKLIYLAVMLFQKTRCVPLLLMVSASPRPFR
jgi:hypothetical protein